jgi:CelD/BcsL family acetyltransferase involved in cellulose biosynthesis
VRLEAVGPAARGAWDDALATDAAAVVSQTPAWLDCVCAVGRQVDATRAYRAPDGRRLVLPLAARPALAVESSMPFGWGVGGLVCAGGRLSADDVAAIAADLAGRRRLRVAVRPTPAADPLWRAAAPAGIARTSHMSQTLELAGGFDHVWTRRFSSNVRRACRRAERLGLAVECDEGGRLVDAFDALYRRSVARWAAAQHEPERLAQWRARRRDPRRKFALVAQRLGPACRLWLARRDGEPLAAIIVLRHGEHSTYWRGAMDRDLALGTGANELLHRLAIERACAEGARWYHMGEAAPGSSLARFKRGFGAIEEPHAGYRFERLPLTAADALLRGQAKRMLGFRDYTSARARR